MIRLMLCVTSVCAMLPLAAQQAAAPALPQEGEEITLTLLAGPIGGAERFVGVPLDTETLQKDGWPAFPGAVGLSPLEAPTPEGAVTMLAASSPQAVRDWYLEECTGVVDVTEEMMAQLEAIFASIAEQEGRPAEPDQIEAIMGTVEACFLASVENGSMVHIFGTQEGAFALIAVTPPMGDPTPSPAPAEDPTEGKAPYDPEGPFVCMETSKGRMYIELFDDLAPVTVANFLKLVDADYYDGLTFHRVIDGFMIQGGDNNKGGPGWAIDLELSAVKHSRGTLSMARTGDPNSAGAQFFVVHRTEGARHLNGQYAAFGRVVYGIEIVDAIVEAAGGETFPAAEECDRIVGVERVSWEDVAAALQEARAAE